jgi:hypothetical protein
MLALADSTPPTISVHATNIASKNLFIPISFQESIYYQFRWFTRINIMQAQYQQKSTSKSICYLPIDWGKTICKQSRHQKKKALHDKRAC